MNIIKQKQMKSKISKLTSHNVSLLFQLNNFKFIKQKISIPSRKAFLSSTVNNTNNNSTSSIKMNSIIKSKQKVLKNTLYNQKMGSMKKKPQMQFSFGDKINLYKKKIFNQKNINSMGIPIDPASHNTTSQYIKYKYLKPNNNNPNEKIIINNTNSNMIISSTTSNLSNITINKNNKIPRKNIINNNSKKPKIKSINTNNYIINTLNVSEKNYISNSSQAQKVIQRNLTEEINKFKKEREELKRIYQKHERLIEKLIEDNKTLSDKIGGIEQENNKLKKKINVYKENQEQLVMLVKIIQQNGVDIEELIDKWNEDIDNEEEITSENEKNDEINSKSLVLDSLNDLHGKIDCSSFIPITVQEKKEEKKMKVSGVPKLNFDILKNNYNQDNRNNHKHKKKRDKFLNNSK